MKDILRQIYAGEVYLEEQMVPKTEEYIQQRETVHRLEDAFYEKLPWELKDDYAEIVEARIRLTGIVAEEACVDGMRVGGRMAAAFFTGPKVKPDGEIYEFEP